MQQHTSASIRRSKLLQDQFFWYILGSYLKNRVSKDHPLTDLEGRSSSFPVMKGPMKILQFSSSEMLILNVC